MASKVSNTSAHPGFARALRVFQRAAVDVPAYGKFLADNGVDPTLVRTPADFAQVPATTKDNYVRAYPLNELLPGGDITAAGTFSASSGSSGAPTYWARACLSHDQGVELHSRIMRGFGADTRPTLVIVGFSMGDWIGGTYTFRCLADLPAHGVPVSVLTPGMDIDLIRADIAALGPYYDQVVVAGYPPFVRDVFDGAPAAVLDQDLKVLMAGEGISESWRDNLLALLGKPGRTQDTCLIYGAADAGMFGHETSRTIAVRRRAENDPHVRAALFGEEMVVPSLVEYDPAYRYFETDESARLICTLANAMPLIRYRINDEGDVHTGAQLSAALGQSRRVASCADPTRGFVSVRGRRDVAQSFYSVKFAPDNIRAALASASVADQATGKFVLRKTTDAAGADRLRLLVELRPDHQAGADFADDVRHAFVTTLCAASAEYRDLCTRIGDRARPIVEPRPYGSAEFRYQLKHDGRAGE
ncbi:phenylacetate--CoA ligase family protein [Nocardia salmonicida]|uniref:phenylacetate--CoA ligase family protein n=1 Tax=Nocardia salmonicida TaxID=53431 RepID=UPI003CF72BEB